MLRIATALLVLGACNTAGGPAGANVDASTTADSDARPELGSRLESRQLCKLLNDKNLRDPTPNDVQHRANIAGADLGIPVVFEDRLYLMFGDTIGFAGIWGGGESHPDAIGYGSSSATAIAAEPGLLCDGLRIVTLDPAQSVGPSVDPAVIADFAGVAMTAPPGHTLGEFIRNPSGGNNGPTFPHLPGDFEVPSGAFAHGDAIYVFYTTVEGPADPQMKASYLARWSQPAVDRPPNDQILYAVDQRFDAAGPLGGHFINISAEVFGDHVYLFGTGAYRESEVYLARKRLDALATPGGFEELGMIIPTRGYGETSVRYFPEIQRWMLLAQEELPTSNRVVVYLADRPEGPWGEPITVHDMGDPSFRDTYCCAVEDDCQAQQMFNCARTGFYGTYLFPSVIKYGSDVTITYTMSSFSPYNVALFQTTFTE